MSGPFTCWRTPGHENSNGEYGPETPMHGRKCASRVQHGLIPYARSEPRWQYPAFVGPDGFSATQSKGRAAENSADLRSNFLSNKAPNSRFKALKPPEPPREANSSSPDNSEHLRKTRSLRQPHQPICDRRRDRDRQQPGPGHSLDDSPLQ